MTTLRIRRIGDERALDRRIDRIGERAAALWRYAVRIGVIDTPAGSAAAQRARELGSAQANLFRRLGFEEFVPE